VIHDREGLALDLEPRNESFGVEADLEELECHAPTNRLDLVGLVHDAHSAFAQNAEQPVGSYTFPFDAAVGEGAGRK
jgi:hypothetical protein